MVKNRTHPQGGKERELTMVVSQKTKPGCGLPTEAEGKNEGTNSGEACKMLCSQRERTE